MSKTQHTPKPWTIHQDEDMPTHWAINSKQGLLGFFDTSDMGKKQQAQAPANAKLIAASPMLLDTLIATRLKITSIKNRLVGHKPHSNNLAWAKQILTELDALAVKAIISATTD